MSVRRAPANSRFRDQRSYGSKAVTKTVGIMGRPRAKSRGRIGGGFPAVSQERVFNYKSPLAVRVAFPAADSAALPALVRQWVAAAGKTSSVVGGASLRPSRKVPYTGPNPPRNLCGARHEKAHPENVQLKLTILTVCGVVFALSVCAAASAQSIFPDKNLEAAVRKEVFEKRNNDQPIIETDVPNISQVVGKGKEGKKVASLAGLEKCRSIAADRTGLQRNHRPGAAPRTEERPTLVPQGQQDQGSVAVGRADELAVPAAGKQRGRGSRAARRPRPTCVRST